MKLDVGTRTRLVAVCTLFGFLACEPTERCRGGGAYIEVPSGDFAAPQIRIREQTSGEPFFSGTYPHGRLSTEPALSAGGMGGAGEEPVATYPATVTVPSARLVIDRDEGIVTRSYLDAAGRSVVERYRIGGAGP